MKAVVTGANGFIGSNLIETLLKNGVEVYATSLSESKLLFKNRNLKFIKLSFEEYDKLEQLLPDDIDYFFHFAWSGVFGDEFKDYSKQLDNIKYACKALEIAVNKHIKKFIFASTMNVSETYSSFGEINIKPRYTNIYASCKLNAELILQTLAYQKGIEFNTGMISMVYGENCFAKNLPNIIISKFLQNKEIDLIPYDTLYDMIYVKEVADAFLKIATCGVNQKHYYIGHKTERKIGEIVDEIKNILSSNSIVHYGKYKNETKLDFPLMKSEEIFKDTNFKLSYDFKETILSTASFIQKNLNFFNE